MIASITNVKEYLQECLKSDKSVYEYSRILFTWPYAGFDCETLNDYARLECIKWMFERSSDTSYVNKSFIYAAWFMIREVTLNLKTLINIWSKNKMYLNTQLCNDFKKMYEYDPLEYSKCLNSEGYSSLNYDIVKIINEVFNNNNIDDIDIDIADEKECTYYINSCY